MTNKTLKTRHHFPAGSVPIWKRLQGRGRLWHRTSLDSLKGIVRDGQIRPNTGQFPTSFGQSKVSRSRHLQGVSLFDFDSSPDPYIEEHEWKWATVLTHVLPAGVLIGIDRDALERRQLMLPAELRDGDPRLAPLPEKIRAMQMRIPAVEAIYLDTVPVAATRELILTAFHDQGGYYWYEEASGIQGLQALTDVASSWKADEDRRRVERHARGDYTLADLIEMANRSAPGRR